VYAFLVIHLSFYREAIAASAVAFVLLLAATGAGLHRRVCKQALLRPLRPYVPPVPRCTAGLRRLIGCLPPYRALLPATKQKKNQPKSAEQHGSIVYGISSGDGL